MLLFDIKFLSRISKNLQFIIHEMYEERQIWNFHLQAYGNMKDKYRYIWKRKKNRDLQI